MSFIQDALEPEYHKARNYRLFIVNRRNQTPHLVSLAAVYGIPRQADLDDVRQQINDIRDQFLDRTFDMARFEKRFPVFGVVADEHYCDQDRLLNAFKLCCWCRPPGVIYPPKTQKKRFKSCGHYNYCPACWARVVEQQFKQYERFIAACVKADSLVRFYATTHISEQFVPFEAVDSLEHAPPETYSAATKVISRRIARFKQAVFSRRRSVTRHTAASMWRIIPIASEGGWRLQLRQFFLTVPGKKPPVTVVRDAKVVFNNTVLLTGSVNDDAIISFIPFAAYPLEHLREDLDLTAAGLSVLAKQRMLGGSGKFKTAGDGLIELARKAKKAASHDERQAEKTKTA
jgi:hypothetical protein